MNDQNLIDIEVRLLILKYGLNRIIQALAHVKNLEPEKIEQLIQELEQRKAQKARLKKITFEEIALRIATTNPEIGPQIIQLSKKYENKVFLPQMNDVRSFLNKNGIEPKSMKSRPEAAKIVFNALSRMPVEELNKLIELSAEGQSDLSIIADQIIGKKSK